MIHVQAGRSGVSYPRCVCQGSFSLTRVLFGTRSGHLCGWRSLIALRRVRVARHSRHLSKSLQSVGHNPSVKIPPPTPSVKHVGGWCIVRGQYSSLGEGAAWRCPHGRRGAGRSAGRVWKRRGKRRRETRRKTERRSNEEQTLSPSSWMV